MALVFVASGATIVPAAHQSERQRTCPVTIQAGGYQGIRSASEIVAAVRRGVPRIFHDYTTQGGGPGWHHYQVLGLLSLSGGYLPEPRAVARYRREATRRCGRAVARNSWVVLLQFPEGPMVSSSFGHMFVAKTGRGWVAW